MGTAAIASCNTTQPVPAPAEGAPAEKEAAPATEAIELEYLSYDLGPANKSREAIRDAFQAANPNIKVKLSILPYEEIWEKLAARMAAGQPPDIIYGDFSLLRYALEGQLLDLTERVKSDPVLAKTELFTTNMMDEIQAMYGTGRIHALIMGTWVPALYYNQEIFDAAKEPYPDESWTWDKVREVAKRLTKPEEEQWGIQFGTNLDHVGWLWWAQKPPEFWAVPQIFPEKTNFNSEAGLGVFSVFHNLGFVDKSAVPPAEAASFQVYAGAFGAGKAALYSGGDWDAGWSFRELPFKWGMTFTPKMLPDYRPALNTMVSTNVISAASKYPDAAWEFIHFMTASKEGQTFIAQGAYETPVLKEVANSDSALKPDFAAPGYEVRVKAAELPGPMYTPYPLNVNLWEFPSKFIDPTIEKLMTGEITPEEAVAYLDGEGNPYFAKQKQEMTKLQ